MSDHPNDVLRSTLLEFLDAGAVIDIYRDRLHPRVPLRCRLLQLSAVAVLVQKFDDLFRDDGLAVARVSDITRVHSGVFGTGQPKPLPVARVRRINEVGLLELSAAATILQREFGVVLVRVEGADPCAFYVGEAVAVDDDFVRLRHLGTLALPGRADALVRTDDISLVEAGGQYAVELLGIVSSARRDGPALA
ncbi:MAG: hypothetical protein KF819_40855 [Labilithrix sp.]|nr:hypothetical protein [Labilithrix sp.]